MADDLARLLLGTSEGTAPLVLGAYMTSWDPDTGANTVSVGGSTPFTNLAYINPGSLSVGPVLLLSSPGGPIILGRLYKATT